MIPLMISIICIKFQKMGAIDFREIFITLSVLNHGENNDQ